jgi:Zn-dependent protease
MPIIFFITMGIPFGGAKPVPINPYLYKNLRWGSLISAAAGPATNLILALVFALGLNISRIAANLGPGELSKLPLTGQFLGACMLTNLFLAVFNMLPIPPLDGSHVLSSLLPRSAQQAFSHVQAAGFMPIMIAVILDGLLARKMGFSILGQLIYWPTYGFLRVMQLVSGETDMHALLRSFMAMRLLRGG